MPTDHPNPLYPGAAQARFRERIAAATTTAELAAAHAATAAELEAEAAATLPGLGWFTWREVHAPNAAARVLLYDDGRTAFEVVEHQTAAARLILSHTEAEGLGAWLHTAAVAAAATRAAADPELNPEPPSEEEETAAETAAERQLWPIPGRGEVRVWVDAWTADVAVSLRQLRPDRPAGDTATAGPRWYQASVDLHHRGAAELAAILTTAGRAHLDYRTDTDPDETAGA